MAEKSLRHLSRGELIEIIYEMQKQEELYRDKEEKYEEKINVLDQKIQDRELKLSETGSIAEAALALNDVFVHAQAAADQYLVEVQKLKATTEKSTSVLLTEAQAKAEATLAEAKSKADIMLAEAKVKSDVMLKDAEQKSREMIAQAASQANKTISEAETTSQALLLKTNEEVAAKTKAFEEKTKAFLDAQNGLRQFLQGV